MEEGKRVGEIGRLFFFSSFLDSPIETNTKDRAKKVWRGSSRPWPPLIWYCTCSTATVTVRSEGQRLLNNPTGLGSRQLTKM